MAVPPDAHLSCYSSVATTFYPTLVYRVNVNNRDVEKLQTDLNRLGEWVVENVMIINPTKSKAVCFTKAQVTEPLNYSLRDIVMPEASSCKYLGIILQ
jgi:hypothetical protein